MARQTQLTALGTQVPSATVAQGPERRCRQRRRNLITNLKGRVGQAPRQILPRPGLGDQEGQRQGGGRVARRFRFLGLEARQGLHSQLTDPLTLTRGLTQRGDEFYPEWIDNDRR